MEEFIEVMRKDRIYTRRTRKNGIKGSSSNNTIMNRRRCIQDIFLIYKNITSTDLNAELEASSKTYHFKMPSTASTLRNDLKALRKKTSFEISEKRDNIQTITPEIHRFRKELFNNIKQVRIKCGEIEHILYSSKNSAYVIDIEHYLRCIRRIRKIEKKHKLLHMYIIIHSSSEIKMEELCNFFEKKCKSILYTSIHNNCIEIVTSAGKIKKLSDTLLLILPQYLGVLSQN